MPVTHPEPTEATVKSLYARASVCAFPKCGQPLYQIDATGTTRTLNSRVTHICARREGGPRWDPAMGANENRGEKNLVILCVNHSYEVDDPGLVDMYPVSLLREWRRAQIADPDRATESKHSDEPVGRLLTGEEIAEVIEASERHTNILVKAHIFETHGADDSSEGSNADSVVLNGTPAGDVPRPPRIVHNDQSKKRAKGGDVLLNQPAMQSEGEGFEGLGRMVAIDATVTDRMTSDRLAVSTLLLANHIAMMPHGLATLVDAGWQHAFIRNLPTPEQFPVFVVIEAGGVPPGEYALTFELRDPSDEVRTRLSMAVVVQLPGDVLRIPSMVGISGNLDAFGIWRIVASSDVAQLASVAVVVRRADETAPPG